MFMYIYMWVLRWLSAKESTCHGQKSLVGYSPWGHKESDMIEHASMHIYIYIYMYWSVKFWCKQCYIWVISDSFYSLLFFIKKSSHSYSLNDLMESRHLVLIKIQTCQRSFNIARGWKDQKMNPTQDIIQ